MLSTGQVQRFVALVGLAGAIDEATSGLPAFASAVVAPTTASPPPWPLPAKAVPGVPDPVAASAVRRSWAVWPSAAPPGRA